MINFLFSSFNFVYVINVSGTVKIDKKVNFEALSKAVNLVIKNNDALRTVIELVNNEPKQKFMKYEEYNVEIVEVKDNKELDILINKIVRKPFISGEKNYLDLRCLNFQMENEKSSYNSCKWKQVYS